MDLKRLVNNDMYKLGRAVDMLWISIGNPRTIEMTSSKGEVKKKEVSDYAIHFQCQWRFIKNGEILLASHDIYNPYDVNLEDNDDWDWDVFGREKEKSNIFDARSAELTNNCLPLKIENIYFSGTDDLHIDFNKGICFDTFITCSRKQEYYRLIDFTDNISKHFVIFDSD